MRLAPRRAKWALKLLLVKVTVFKAPKINHKVEKNLILLKQSTLLNRV
jgi:hypothetical protein